MTAASLTSFAIRPARDDRPPGLAWTLGFAHVLAIHLVFAVSGVRAVVAGAGLLALIALDATLAAKTDVPRWPRAGVWSRSAWAAVAGLGASLIFLERLARETRIDPVTESAFRDPMQAPWFGAGLATLYAGFVFAVPVLLDARGRRGRWLMLALAILGAVLVHLALASGDLHGPADT